MSEGTRPGPGWWQASDGNWYPPEQRPRSSPVPLPGWWQASDGNWYPAEQGTTPSPPFAGGHWWLASDGNWYPPETSPGQAPPAPPTSLPPGGDEFVFEKPDRPRRKRRRPPVLATLIAVTALVVAAGVGIAIAASLSGPSTPGAPTTTSGTSERSPTSTLARSVYPSPQPSMSSLLLLGGPVAADGRLLVIDVSPQRHLELSAVSPVTETVVWRRPFSPSVIAPGEVFAPAVFGDIVIDLEPYGSAPSAFVDVLGVDIATGRVVWTYREPGETADAPELCAGKDTLCLSWQSESTSGLIEVDPANGQLLRSVPGVARDLGENIYETRTAAPTLQQIGSNGEPLWQRPAATIFGPVDDNPDYGWDIDPIGHLDVGSLGSTPNGSVVNLGAATTTGFEISTGRTVWTDPGLYNCSGPLEVFSVPVLCRFKGTFTQVTDGSPSLRRVSLQIEGFNPRTGAVRWEQPDAAVAGAVGTGVLPFSGDDSIVLEQKDRYRLLDEATGSTAPLSEHTPLWCARAPFVHVSVVEPAGSGYIDNRRLATDEFYVCDATGAPVAGRPVTEPSIVGVTLDGKFFWPTAHGLASVPALHRSSR